MLVRQHRPARQHRIAMLAVPGVGVGTVDRLIALRRQKVGLRQLRPTREISLLAPVNPAHFLQTHDVRVQLLDRMPKVVNF